jgi:hypothetical protein
MSRLPSLLSPSDHDVLRRVVANDKQRHQTNRVRHPSQRSGYGYRPDKQSIVQVWNISGSVSAGDVLEANSGNVFPGRVRTWANATVNNIRTCWIGFVDWFDSDLGDVYALQGKHFMGRFSGEYTVDATSAPLYVVAQGNFECWCKADSAIAKGATGTVSLYNDDFTDSTINRASVLAKFMAVDTVQWCRMTRVMGTYIVQPEECPA